MNKGKLKRLSPGKAATRALLLSVIPIIGAFIALTYSFVKAAEISPAYAMLSYPDMFSYIYSSILLALLGGFLLDAVEREKGR